LSEGCKGNNHGVDWFLGDAHRSSEATHGA
jgi:hypothetical protein